MINEGASSCENVTGKGEKHVDGQISSAIHNKLRVHSKSSSFMSLLCSLINIKVSFAVFKKNCQGIVCLSFCKDINPLLHDTHFDATTTDSF